MSSIDSFLERFLVSRFLLVVLTGWLSVAPGRANFSLLEAFCEGDALGGDLVIADQQGDLPEDERDSNHIDAAIGPDGDVVAVVDIVNPATETNFDRAVLLKRAADLSEVVVVKTGDPLTLGDREWSVRSVEEAMVTKGGQVYVHVTVVAGRKAILSYGEGGLTVVAYEGQTYALPAEELSGLGLSTIKESYYFLGQIAVDPAGDLIILGSVQTIDVDNQSVFTEHLWKGGLTEAKRQRKLSGLPIEGFAHPYNSVEEIRGVNREGDLLLYAFTGENGEGGSALVLWENGQFSYLASRGQPLPGGPGEVRIMQNERLAPGNGWACFQADFFTGDQVDRSNDRAIFVAEAGEVHLVAREGGDVPGRPDCRWWWVQDPVVSAQGRVIFLAACVEGELAEDFSNLTPGLWQWENGTVTPLALGAELAGGGDITNLEALLAFSTESVPVLLSGGEVVYGMLAEPGDFEAGAELWVLENSGQARPLVEKGTPIGFGQVASLITDEDKQFRGLTKEAVRLDDQGQMLVDVTLEDGRQCLGILDPCLRAGVAIGVHRVSSIASDSVLAGRVDPHASLVPRTLLSQLDSQAEVGKGLVADGVTPLLFSLTRSGPLDEGFTRFRLAADIVSGGEVVINGNPTTDLTPKFYWHEVSDDFRDGEWQALVDSVALAPEGSALKRYAYLEGIKADDLRLKEGSNEVVVQVTLTPIESPNETVGLKTFFIRKPPVTLVHGYNTNGDWGEAFKRILGRSRPYEENDDANNFVRQVTYGQEKPLTLPTNLTDSARQSFFGGLVAAARRLGFGDKVGVIDENFVNHENTALPMADLLPQLDQALSTSLAPLRTNWAFTRHDVVAHSQGGLLTRMLSSERGVEGSHPDYQSPENFYRGRFHRAITIGSPHNGSRILGYLLMLDRNAEWSRLVPKGIATIGVFSGLAQAKFDPFGEQIVDLNTSPRWLPDPDAPFHLVRTTINEGMAPSFNGDTTPLALFLGLNGESGDAVLPRGSDGIVDFDSMGGLAESQVIRGELPDNIFTLSPKQIVSHSGPVPLFSELPNGPTAKGQVASEAVALHVQGALDQSNGAIFDEFPVPELLDEDVRARIQEAAVEHRATIDQATTALGELLSAELERSLEDAKDRIFEYALQLPPGRIASRVRWFAEVYGLLAETAQPVALRVMEEGPCLVEVRVPKSFVGDVVLKAYYEDDETGIMPLSENLVTAVDPPAQLNEVAVLPGGGQVTEGQVLTPGVYAFYEGGEIIRRYADDQSLTVSSSDPEVIDVSDPTGWVVKAVGQATVTSSYLGKESLAEFVVSESGPSIPGHDESDRDGDGVVDLLEEAFGTDPDRRDPPNLPSMGIAMHDGREVPAFDLSVPTGGSALGEGGYEAGEFRYTLQGSEDLVEWRSLGQGVTLLPPRDGAGRDLVRALLIESDVSFLRVHVERR